MNRHERFTDKSTKAAREAIEKGAWSAGEAANGAKLNLLSLFTGMRELNITLIDMVHANTDAVFDLAHDIASAKTPPDLMAIWSAYASRKFEMMTKQSQELAEMGQKFASRRDSPARNRS